MTVSPTTATRSASERQDVVMPFLLLALHPGQGAGWHQVGRYQDFASAVAAHVEDVLEQLEANDGWLTTTDHLIVGPGLDGSVAVWPQTTSLGADPSNDRVPDPYDRQVWRGWLEQSHRPAQ